ncbi:MAG TPA: ABC transporter permease [Acidobacteriaceae bacterium]|jgi:predicted permease|nr:ABC transporter permease [Acidobacteriaceae bacterium]
MRWLNKFRLRLQMLLHRRRESTRLDAELTFHLEQQTAENRAAGMEPKEAREAALRSFGNPTLLRDETRASWSWNGLERLAQDVRFGTRQVLRAPGFAVVAILTLALGIGANTAVFTLTHALLLSSLPVPDPDQLVRLAINLHADNPDANNSPLNLPMIQDLSRRSRSFNGVFGWSVYDFAFKDGGVTRGLRGAILTGNGFQTLGIHPAMGRLLTPADDQPGGGPDGWAAVISHRLWVEQYHADPAVIGRHIMVTDHGVTIVGVAPEGFEGIVVAEHPDLYLPIEFSAAINNSEADLHQGGNLWLTAFARLKPGVSRRQAAVEAATLFPALLDDALPPRVRHLPVVEKSRLDVDSARTGWTTLRMQYTQPLLLLQAMVGVVLLICCANLSGLLLARASARQQEFAIRGALGAARSRLVRQLLVESLMLAIPGALLGVVLAWMAGPWMLHSLGNSQAEVSLSLRPNLAVLATTAACACLCALLFGMAPAWIASRTNLEAALRSSSRHATGRGAGLRRMFVPLQVALSLVLVVVAALLGTTVVHLRTGDSGYRTQNVVFYIADFGRLQQRGVDLVPLYRRIVRRMEEMPGVDAASVVEILPFYGWIYDGAFTTAADTQHGATASADVNEVGADYFRAVGTPMLAGRDFRNDDADEHSCVLSRSAARLYFPQSPALGKVLQEVRHDMSRGTTTVRDCQIIGIVQDTKYDTVHEAPPPIVYRAISAQSGRLTGLFFVIHGRSVAEGSAAYHQAIHELAPESPETDPATFTQLFSDSMAREQLLSVLSGFFAFLALLLSGIGIYGLVAWNVAQRTTEIGLRMALGASHMRVFTMVLRQIAMLLAVGILAGGVAAFFAARSVRSFLFEIQAGNPAVFVAAALMLAGIGLLAAVLPARRAVSIDPMQALRSE